MAKTNQERFWEKVNKTDSCWLWTAAKSVHGYGRLNMQGTVEYAHRLSYSWFVGPLIKGMHLDHLCRNPSCVRPTHLEQVTPQENILRGEGPAAKHAAAELCSKGHEFDYEEVLPSGRIKRRCKTCRAERNREYYLTGRRN